MKPIVLVLVAGVLVAGCVAPRLLSKTEESIAFRVNTGLLSSNVDEATNLASSHCGKYNRNARLQGISERIATFHCVQ